MKSKYVALITLFGLLAVFLSSCDDDEVIVTITANDLVLSIDENPTNGQVLGTIPSETNQGTLEFSLTDQDPAGAFALNASTGEITVADASLFDYEQRTALTATVLIVNGAIEEEVMATVNLNDVQESLITTAVTNNEHRNNAYLMGDNTRVYFATGSTPFVMIDGYNSDYTYRLLLEGVHHGETFTASLSSTQAITDTEIVALYFNADPADLASDYYYAELLEVETDTRFAVMTDEGARTRFVDTDASDYWADIRIENQNFTPVDIIESKTDFRMRPTPSQPSTAGKLYFYDQNLNPVDSISSSGASGSSQTGTTLWFSFKFRGENGVNDLNLTSGDYKINFRAPGGKQSPIIDIEFVKQQ